jgi:hypothetical protein
MLINESLREIHFQPRPAGLEVRTPRADLAIPRLESPLEDHLEYSNG